MNARQAIRSAFEAALNASDPELAVRSHLAAKTGDETSPVWCIAIGKAAAPMLAGAIDQLGAAIRAGFLITKDDHLDRAFDDRFVLREASHPVLDERTLAATADLLDWARHIPAHARVLVLLSGGGSALLERPVEAVSLADFQAMTRALLNGGADINQLNGVRSQVSQVKGGRLRAAIPAARVETFALSDVLGNDPAVIASGPTVTSNRTHADAIAVIEALGVGDRIPGSVWSILHQPPPPAAAPRDQDTYTIVADNQIAIAAAANDLRAHGLNVMEERQIAAGEARDTARSWVERLREIPPEVDAVIAGGELTVTVRGDGIGGRNTEFALAAAIALHEYGVTGWTIASLATDGQDADSGLAGAIVDGQTVTALVTAGIDPGAALAANDSAAALQAIDATVFTGPTGTNVNDLYFAIRNRRD